MKIESPGEAKKTEDRENRGTRGPEARKHYQSPRIVKKRAVSRATLFTGSGPDSGGVVGSG